MCTAVLIPTTTTTTTTQIENTNTARATNPTPTTEVEAAVLVETLLSQWASGDSKKVELLKYIIGASITDKAWAFKQPDGTYSNAIVVVYGSGDNGKSAYIKLLEKAVIAAGAKDKFYSLSMPALWHLIDVSSTLLVRRLSLARFLIRLLSDTAPVLRDC